MRFIRNERVPSLAASRLQLVSIICKFVSRKQEFNLNWYS